MDDRLSGNVIDCRDGQIDISREAGLRASRHGEAPHEAPRRTRSLEVREGVAELPGWKASSFGPPAQSNRGSPSKKA